MNMNAQSNSSTTSVILAGIVFVVGLAGFGGWLVMGGDVFIALLQTGLRWCL